MEVDAYSAPINPKPSSNGISAKSNIRPLKRHNAMATLADVAVEEQESTRVQQGLEALFHLLCVLFGLLIMLLLTESTLYWLNRIWTPRPPNKKARLLGRINNWTNKVGDESGDDGDDGDGIPPNTLASNSLTGETADPPSSTAPSSMTKATTVSSAASGVKHKGNVQLSAALSIRPSKVGLYL